MYVKDINNSNFHLIQSIIHVIFIITYNNSHFFVFNPHVRICLLIFRWARGREGGRGGEKHPGRRCAPARDPTANCPDREPNPPPFWCNTDSPINRANRPGLGYLFLKYIPFLSVRTFYPRFYFPLCLEDFF